jgi:hypothetical protein
MAGDMLSIRYYLRDKKDPKNPDSIRRAIEVVNVETTSQQNDKVIKEFSGILSLKYHRGDADPSFAFVDDYVVKAEATAVSLFRPFAQINFCTDDYSRVTDLNHTMTSTVEVAKAEVPSVLNLITGAVSIPVAVKFVATAVPAATGETIDVMVNGVKTTYSNVAMNYILASDESVNLTDMTATFNYNNDKVVVSVPNLPYQRNWRTNVFGSLFTVDAVFNIEVAPVFPNDHNKDYE